jgi:hypothetical protein
MAEHLVHLVLRTHYEELGSGLLAASHAADEGDPLCAFADRGHAEEWREQLEEAERRKTEPFWFARPTEPTNAILTAQARDRGLMPPSLVDPGGYDPDGWSWWWQRVVIEQPESGGLWEDFGGGRFYETAPVPLDGEMPRGDMLFVVRQISWARDDRTGLYRRRSDFTGRIVFARPVRAFADRSEADAFRTQVERHDRVGQNPFDYVTDNADPLVGRTSLDQALLHDWLLECGAARVPDRQATTDGWRAWWARTVRKLSPLHQAKAIEAFDGVPLYDVAEAPWDDGM